uniref:Isopenicillin N synthase-like Fe(2+) 2OG dioxygenase domain-containing protein n=1 Tax=Zea mays TaxID=4577 RepID=A0A804UIH0_MAIZE
MDGWIDCISVRVEPEDERNLVHWPQHPKTFRGLLHEYTLNCKRIKDCILGTTAKTLGLGEDCFARFNYYPPCPRPDLVFGVKPHSDSSGVLTILLIDKDVSGLQVLRDGVWHNNVPASPFMLLINVGDFMEAVGLTTLTDADN